MCTCVILYLDICLDLGWSYAPNTNTSMQPELCALKALMSSDIFLDSIAPILDAGDFIRLALTCKLGETVAKTPSMWRTYCHRQYRVGVTSRQVLEMGKCMNTPCQRHAKNDPDWRKVCCTLRKSVDPHTSSEVFLRKIIEQAGEANCRIGVPVQHQGLRAAWAALSYADRLEATWQREYRVITSMLTSLMFLSPFLIDTENAPQASSLTASVWRDSRRSNAWSTERNTPPPITAIQALIELAWEEGFDLEGSEYFGARLVGVSRPIGATECAALLRSLGVKATLFDFRSPDPETGLHTAVMEICRMWFLSENSFRFPLYLQYGSSFTPGGSLLVVGMCRSAALHPPPNGEEAALPQDALGAKTPSTWAVGEHGDWDTLLILNPDSPSSLSEQAPLPLQMAMCLKVVLPSIHCVQSMTVAEINWPMCQIVGCGTPPGPLFLSEAEREEWKRLTVGHVRVPPQVSSWGPEVACGFFDCSR